MTPKPCRPGAVLQWASIILAAATVTTTTSAASQPAECAANGSVAGRVQVAGDGFRLLFAPRPAVIQVGQHFELTITLCPRAGAQQPVLLKVDADMPAHRHGMNYRATVQPVDEGRFQAQGLMWHMPGRWRLTFDLADERGAARLTHEVEIE